MTETEYECRKCGKRVSSEKYKESYFCPNCSTHLHLRPRPKHWLFQFNPATYRWLDRIKETKEPEQWLASQHSTLIRLGDMVVIWGAGLKSGVYALGEVIANPTRKPLNSDQQKYFLRKEDSDKFCEKLSVIVKYSKVISDNPLLQNECNQDPVLSEMSIFMKNQGTNFRLETEKWNRIVELIERRDS